MRRRAGNAIVLILTMTFISYSRADVLSYAREWTSRDSENNPLAQPTTQEAKPSAQRSGSNVQKTTPVENSAKKRKVVAIKEEAPQSIKIDNRGAKRADVNISAIKTDSIIMKEGRGNKMDGSLPNPQVVGKWVQSLMHHILLNPTDAEIRNKYLAQRDALLNATAKLAINEEEIIRLNNTLQELRLLEIRTRQLEEKNARWQLLTQKLQQNLKEAQYPSLPTTDGGLTDFAAGMAMGLDVLEVLKQHDEQGVHIDKADFLAGIAETVRGERRLTQEQFEYHLKMANQRVQNALQKVIEDRALRDSRWLETFINDEKTFVAGKEAWYRVTHVGEALSEDNHNEEKLTISLIRRLTDGKLIADSDISGLVLEERFGDLPGWLQVVVNAIRLNGEAELAVKVNEYGDPSEQGAHVEHWRIRVTQYLSM